MLLFYVYLMKKRVIIESPYNNENYEIVLRNIRYARSCVHDSLMRGENPYASHIFFTQSGILDDNNSDDRKSGMEAGWEMAISADFVAVYTDLSISYGMKQGIERHRQDGRKIEYRLLGDNWEKDYFNRAGKHSHKDVWNI